MSWGILIPFLAYEIITIAGVSIYLMREGSANKEEGFTLGGRSMGLAMMVPTMVLVMLGTGHTIGALESVYTYGWVQVWFVIGHVFILSLGCVTTAIWARRMRGSSIAGIMGTIYNEEMKICVAAVNAMFTWGIASIEIQGMAVLLNTMTGLDIKLGILIGGVLGLGYTLFAGIKQTAILNFINLFVLYIGLAIAVFYIAMSLPGQNFDTIKAYYEANDPTKLNYFGTMDSFVTYAIPSVIAPLFCHSAGQMLLQPAMAAKSEKIVKKTVWFCGPINCLVGIFIVTIGMTAKAKMDMGELADFPAKIYAWQYMLNTLPTWVMSFLCASVFAGVISSFAGGILSPATIFMDDIWKRYWVKDMNQQKYNRHIRAIVIILVVLATGMAQFLPGVINGLNWLFAWNIPTYFLLAIGLYWKVNKKWNLTVLLITWGCNCIWSFTPIYQLFGFETKPHEAYVVTIISLVLLVVGNLILKGESAYFRSEGYLRSEAHKLARAEELGML